MSSAGKAAEESSTYVYQVRAEIWGQPCGTPDTAGRRPERAVTPAPPPRPAAAKRQAATHANASSRAQRHAQSPGSSIRDPVLTGTSMGNPVYEYDPRPADSKQAQPIQAAGKAPLGVKPPQQQQAARPTAASAAQHMQRQQQQQRADAAATYVYTPPGEGSVACSPARVACPGRQRATC